MGKGKKGGKEREGARRRKEKGREGGKERKGKDTRHTNPSLLPAPLSTPSCCHCLRLSFADVPDFCFLCIIKSTFPVTILLLA